MGIHQSCELDRMSNLCDMHKCIDHLQGRASTSASDTDTWVAKLSQGTTFDGEPIRQVFLKIGVSPASVRIQPGDPSTFYQREAQFEKKMRASLGLQYEFQVYDRIIRPILDNDVCILFLRPYLASYNCRYDDLLATLKEGLHNQPADKVQAALNRNLSFIMNGPKVKSAEEVKAAEPGKPDKPEKRKAIHDFTPDDESFDQPSPDVRYMVLATEFKPVSSYYQFLRTVDDTYDDSAVLMQILVALFTMEKSRLMHNDLHGFNILIEQLAKPVVDTYEIEGIEPFTVTIRYRVKIFDFDHASCDFLGPNPLWPSQGFEQNRDLACLYRWLLPQGQTVVERSLIDEVFNTKQIVADFKKVTAAGERDLRWCDAQGKQLTGSIFAALKKISAEVNNQPRLEPSPFPFVINQEIGRAHV